MSFRSKANGRYRTFCFSQEQNLIKQEILGKYLSVIFDGTTRLGEAMAIVVRYVDSEW